MRHEPLEFDHCKDFNDNPIIIVVNFPGLYAMLTPEQCRIMAGQLLSNADRAEWDNEDPLVDSQA